MEITDEHIYIFKKFKRAGSYTSLGWHIKNINKHIICKDLVKLNVITKGKETFDGKHSYQYYKYINGSSLPKKNRKKSIILYFAKDTVVYNEFKCIPTIKRRISHKFLWVGDEIIIDDIRYNIWSNEKSQQSVFIVINDLWYECKNEIFRNIIDENRHVYVVKFSKLPPLKKSLDYLISKNS